MEKAWFRAVRWAVSLGAIGVVAWQLAAHRGELGAGWGAPWTAGRGWAMLGLVALAPVNWGLEWWKWGVLSPPWRGWTQLAREYFFGAAAGFVTPNRVGEGVGRLAWVPRAQREGAARGYLAGAVAQGWVTLAVGGAVLAAGPHPAAALLGGALCATAAGTLFAFLRWNPPLGRWLPVWERLVGPRHPDRGALSLRQRGSALALGVLRYATFTAQFWLAFAAAGCGWTAEQARAVPLVLLGNTFAPGALLGELGVREALTWAILQPAGDEVGATLLAPFLVWLVNLVFPAAVGAVWGLVHPVVPPVPNEGAS